MPITVTFLGHSACLLDNGKPGGKVLIDPFLTGNPKASPKPEHAPDAIGCDVLALTHGHADHLGDSIAIAKRTGCTCATPYELGDYFMEQGVEAVEQSNPGGRVPTPFGHIAFTPTMGHSSSYEGRYMGICCGLLVHYQEEDTTIYHAGDTALFSDMKLIGQLGRPKLALLPVGGRFTMTPALGKIAAEYVGADVAVPIHYGTFPILAQDLGDFTPQGVEVRKLEPGESTAV